MPEISKHINNIQVDEAYKDKKKWTKMSILNAVRAGKFSSDRSIQEYAKNIWNIEPCKVIENILKEEDKQMKETHRIGRIDSLK